MNEYDLANAIFNNKQSTSSPGRTVSIIQGEAVSDSVDGMVRVKIEGEGSPSISGEDAFIFEMKTTPEVKTGDKVTVTKEGGVLKTMTVTGNSGSGDRTAKSAQEATKTATDFIQLTDDNNIIIGNLSDEVAQNDAGDTNIVLECTGKLTKNDTEIALVDHIHEGLFCTQSFSQTYTVTASGITASVNLPSVDGYVPFSMRSFSYSTFSGLYLLNHYFTDDSRYVFSVCGTSGSEQTGTITFEFLYIKDGWM